MESAVLGADLPNVKIHRHPSARLPTRSTPGSAGYDVSACIAPDQKIVIPPSERISVPTGLFFEIPPGYFITLRPRSGLALKHGVTLLNAPATIDSDYRGELRVILINHGADLFEILNGDRIAQLLLERVTDFRFEETPYESLAPSERGVGGFGSTGLA
jgi:dUTP pyrophosphatase